jgi:glycerol kinase
MKHYVIAIDQGTTSTRCMGFDPAGAVVSSHQVEHRQLLTRAGLSSTTPKRSGPTHRR